MRSTTRASRGSRSRRRTTTSPVTRSSRGSSGRPSSSARTSTARGRSTPRCARARAIWSCRISCASAA
jgi:hypothetical protein